MLMSDDSIKNASTDELKRMRADIQQLADSYVKGSQPNATEAEKKALKQLATSAIDQELKKRGH